MIKNIRHTGIVVKDLEMSLHFYRDLLGFQIVKRMEESGDYIDNISALHGVKVTTVKMSAHDGQLVELLHYHSHPTEEKPCEVFDTGISHIAFTVDDLNGEYNRLKNAGVPFNAPPQLSPDGYAKVTFCHDPDGTSIELVEVLNSSPLTIPTNYISTIYDEKTHPYTIYPSQLCKYLFDRFDMEKEQRLIDIGCGRGEFLYNFKELGLIVNGIDCEEYSSNFLKDIEVRHVDLEKGYIPFDDETFDVVFSKSVIEHIHDPSIFLPEVHRILKKGGIAIIMTPDWVSNMKIYFDDYTHRTPFTTNSMREALKMFGFRNVNAELFYQLPILWRFPSLKLLSWLIRLLTPVTLKSNIKFIRWSCELMVLGYGEK